MNLFNKHSDTPPSTVSRPWLPKPPADFTDVIGLDYGKRAWTFFSAFTGEHWTATDDEFVATWSRLPKGSLVVVERAHFQVFQTYKNIAQPMKEGMYHAVMASSEERGITVRVMSQTISPSVRACIAADDRFASATGKKGDLQDAMAIGLYVACINEVSLELPKGGQPLSPVQVHYRRVVGAANNMLSAIASKSISSDYDCDIEYPEMFRVCEQAADMLPREAMAYLGQKGLFSVVCLMCGYDKNTGRLCRFTHNGHRYGKDKFSKLAVGNRPPRSGSGKARAMLCMTRFKANGSPRKDGVLADYTGKPAASADPAIREAGKAAWAQVRAWHKLAWKVVDEITAGLPNLDI